MSLLSSSSAKRPWQSSREVEKIAPNQNGSKLRGRTKFDEESLAFDERSHLAYGLIADQISAPVLSAPTDLLREQIRWSTAPTVLGQTEPAEPPNRTPDPAAPSDLVLLLGTNRMRPGRFCYADTPRRRLKALSTTRRVSSLIAMVTMVTKPSLSRLIVFSAEGTPRTPSLTLRQRRQQRMKRGRKRTRYNSQKCLKSALLADHNA